MRLKYIFLSVCLLVVAYFVFDSLSQPNTRTLAGNFKEVAMYRNPNNTGPIVRIFAVTVDDTLTNEMQQYGAMMPYTKYGTTTVFFFKNDGPAPEEISPNPPHFPQDFKANCIGRYQKDAMGMVTFENYSARKNKDSVLPAH
jgi:hypothetical protein